MVNSHSDKLLMAASETISRFNMLIRFVGVNGICLLSSVGPHAPVMTSRTLWRQSWTAPKRQYRVMWSFYNPIYLVTSRFNMLIRFVGVNGICLLSSVGPHAPVMTSQTLWRQSSSCFCDPPSIYFQYMPLPIKKKNCMNCLLYYLW